MSPLLNLLIFSTIFGIAYNMEVPCCVSKKFYGNLKITTGSLTKGATVPTITVNQLIIDHDRDLRMERYIGTIFRDDGMQQTLTNYSIISDYRHEKRYSYNATWCTIEHVDNEDMSNGCVPKGLTWAGVYRFGSGNNSVPVNAWEGDFEGLHWTMATTVDDCTPVSYTRFGTDNEGTRITENTLYSDFVQYALSGAHVFDIPQHCQVPGNIVG